MELGGVDTTAAQAVPSTLPWLVLGAVLGIGLLVLVGFLLFLTRRSADRPPPLPERNDLPGFLEHPPGSPGAPAPAAAGWPALAPVIQPDDGTRSLLDRRSVGALAALAATLLVLVGVTAALAAADRDPQASPAGPTTEPRPDGVAARLAFGGVVLEQRAVGVTATYPRIDVTTDGGKATAHLELPTWNCLTDGAPPDPVAAGCARSRTEFADLSEPELTLTGEDDGVRLSGRFPTSLRPNGTEPEETGRSYELTVTAEPAAGASDDGWMPADGVLELGDDSARTTPDSRLRLEG